MGNMVYIQKASLAIKQNQTKKVKFKRAKIFKFDANFSPFFSFFFLKSPFSNHHYLGVSTDGFNEHNHDLLLLECEFDHRKLDLEYLVS